MYEGVQTISGVVLLSGFQGNFKEKCMGQMGPQMTTEALVLKFLFIQIRNDASPYLQKGT